MSGTHASNLNPVSANTDSHQDKKRHLFSGFTNSLPFFFPYCLITSLSVAPIYSLNCSLTFSFSPSQLALTNTWCSSGLPCRRVFYVLSLHIYSVTYIIHGFRFKTSQQYDTITAEQPHILDFSWFKSKLVLTKPSNGLGVSAIPLCWNDILFS